MTATSTKADPSRLLRLCDELAWGFLELSPSLAFAIPVAVAWAITGSFSGGIDLIDATVTEALGRDLARLLLSFVIVVGVGWALLVRDLLFVVVLLGFALRHV